MATKFVTNLDLNGNQILNARLQAVASDPDTGNFEGRLIYRTDTDCIKYFDGSAWEILIKGVSSGGDHSNALTVTESSGGVVTITANLANSSNAGLLSSSFYDLLNGSTASPTGNTLAKRDSSGRLQVATPSSDDDAANKAYVDAARSGLDVKASVRLATAGALPAYTHSNGVLTASSNGALSIDNISVAETNRILVKNETSSNAPYNGIYEVTNTGGESAAWVLTRASDANSSAEVTAGMFTFVSEGDTNADSGWVLTTNDTITLGSTSLSFVQFSGAGQITAGDGLSKDGNIINVGGTTDRISVGTDSIDIANTYVGQTSITTLGTVATGSWEATDIGVAHGGTGASTASGARTNLADTTAGFTTSTPVLARIASQTIGNGSDLNYAVTHNFGTRDVVVQVYDVASYDTVVADVVRTNTNAVTVSFSSIPTSNSYRVVVTG